MLKGSVCPLGPCQGYGVKFFDVDGDFLKESSTVTANLGPSRNTLLFSFWHLLMFRTRDWLPGRTSLHPEVCDRKRWFADQGSAPAWGARAPPTEPPHV
jgi:hypothetical protein